MSILVSGGAGYIGSHTCVELLQAGYDVVVADNLCNSSEKSLQRVETITGKKVSFIKAELCDPAAVEDVFAKYPDIEAVIHFAGLKIVGESIEKPIEYYNNNMTGTFVLVEHLRKYNCKNIIFSSSASVYGNDPTFIETFELLENGNIKLRVFAYEEK